MSEALPKKRRWLLRLTVRAILLLFVLVSGLAVALGLGGLMLYNRITQPGVAGAPVRVEIPEGANGRVIGEILAQANLVEHEMLIRAAMRLDKTGGIVKHGAYDLPQGLSPAQLVARLKAGPNVRPGAHEIASELKVTIPEGLTIRQIAALLDEPDAFFDAASDPALIAQVGVDVDSLEGFLMPNTYFFAKKPGAREVAERMLEQFLKEYDRLCAEIAGAHERDMLEAVTVASLIEEEARVDEERPLVAAVIYNRLARNMPLDLDSTLQYALNKYGERMLNVDKEADSPYNTYRHPGLPPGPICNPGIACLRAALAPADAGYLYFVSNADGRTHTFSSTIAEHNRAVARFRREIAPQRRRLQEQQREAGAS